MARVGAVRHPWRTFRDSRPRRLGGGVRPQVFGIRTCPLVGVVGARTVPAPLLLAGEGGAKRRVRVRRFAAPGADTRCSRSEEHTSELQSLMRISYAVFCLKKKTKTT